MIRLASVAVPVPHSICSPTAFPTASRRRPRCARVLVPIGTRTLTGCVIGTGRRAATTTARAAADGLRDIFDVLDGDAYVPRDVLTLAAWVAEYYACGPGEVIAAAVPSMAWLESRRVVSVTSEGIRAVAEGAVHPIRALACRVLETSRCRAEPARVDARARDSSKGAGARPARPPAAGACAANARRRRPRRCLAGPRRRGRRLQDRARGGTDAAGARVGRTRGRRGPPARREAARTADGAGPGTRRPVGGGVARARFGCVRRFADWASASSSAFAARQSSGIRSPDRGAEQAHAGARTAHVTLTPEQDAALERLRGRLDAGAFHVALVHGVTGSGKTELYLRLADRRAGGRRALVLVPEIALTPGAGGAFRARFGERVAIQHSGLSDGERHDQWQRIRRGDVDVVVGHAVGRVRAAAGSSASSSSTRSTTGPTSRTRARGTTVATWPSSAAGSGRALVVLGSATPSLETLPQRAARALRAADARAPRARSSAGARSGSSTCATSSPTAARTSIVSRPLAEAIAARLERREQVLLLLNRRGFSTSVFCRQCGEHARVPELQRVARRARAAGARGLPLLQPRAGGAADLSDVRRRRTWSMRASAPNASRPRCDRLSRGARGAHGPRHGRRRRGAAAELLARFGERRDRRPRRHADDRQGARLSRASRWWA